MKRRNYNRTAVLFFNNGKLFSLTKSFNPSFLFLTLKVDPDPDPKLDLRIKTGRFEGVEGLGRLFGD